MAGQPDTSPGNRAASGTAISGSQSAAVSAGWPLTEAQSGLWYAQKLDPQNPVFNVAHLVTVTGQIDQPLFERSVNKAIAEADALAVVISETSDGPEQCFDTARRARIEYFDYSGHEAPEQAAREAVLTDLRTALDLARDNLARTCLYRVADNTYLWYLRAHHIVVDGYGMNLLTDRVAELYSAAINGRQAAAAPPSFQVAVEEDAAYQDSGRRDKDADFWREVMASAPAVASMAPGRAVSASSVHRLESKLAAETGAQIQSLAASLKLPWPDVLTVIVALYCQRMAGAEGTVVGVPFMGRFGSRAANVPAMLMNVLPVGMAIDEAHALSDLCVEVARHLAGARRHGRYRSEQLRRDLGLLGGDRRLYGPLINVLPFDRPPRLEGVTTRIEVLATGPVDDITFTFRGEPTAGLTIEAEANPLLYSEADASAHIDRLAGFIAAVVSTDPVSAGALENVPLVSAAEFDHLIVQCNATEHEVTRHTLTALIEQSMQRRGDSVALVFAGQSLTYAELDQRSNALAMGLVAAGIGTEDIVAVAMPRSIELVIALVAVLRAGAAYLPLDPEHPPERLNRLVTAAQAKRVLAAKDLAEKFSDAVPVVTPDTWPQSAPGLVRDIAANRPQSNSAAYVIYTSGSTGEPKGVLVEHSAIVNRLEWMRVHYGFDETDRILQKTPATFDVSVWEFFLPLITGAVLVIARPGEHRDPRALAGLIRDESVTTVHFVPSMLATFLACPEVEGLCLRRVFCSGEALNADHRDNFHRLIRADLHNLYGPTEAAVDVSYWPAEADSNPTVPIGFPVWNTRLYVLDASRRPVPAGVAGQLFIAGVQLARGYLGRDDLTAERFVPDPFHPDQRMYLTGDLAIRRADDAIEFLGRFDDQIKVRGLRIEPGEIESALIATGLVQQAGVIAREDRDGDKRIVAYLVANSDFDETVLRRELAASLPDYMLPAAFVALETLPVTSNGKLDRKALPAPVFESGGGRQPESATEITVAALFAEVLGLAKPAAADSDFFSLGGDSLLAVQLMLAIERELGRGPGLGVLFTHSTVAALSRFLDVAEEGVDQGLGPLIELVSGQAGKPAVFMVHPAGGIAWCYRQLARSLENTTVYGLQAPALDPAVELAGSINALAEEYVDRILALNTPGPIHLLGWSVGGIVAHAMAVRLQQLGRQVGLLAVLDAYPADCWRDEPEPDEAQALRALLAIAGYDPEAHTNLTTRESIVRFLRAGGSALGRLPAATLDGVIRVVTGTNQLVRHHRHGKFKGPLLHVRAASSHQDGKLSPRRWTPYVDSVDVLDLPFEHADLPGADAAARIAPTLKVNLAAINHE